MNIIHSQSHSRKVLSRFIAVKIPSLSNSGCSLQLSDPTSARLWSRTISPLKVKTSSTTEVPLPKRHPVYFTNMLRQSLIQNLKPGLRSTIYPATRAISTTAVKMGEGDTGATRSGGSSQRYTSTHTSHTLTSLGFRQIKLTVALGR